MYIYIYGYIFLPFDPPRDFGLVRAASCWTISGPYGSPGRILNSGGAQSWLPDPHPTSKPEP